MYSLPGLICSIYSVLQNSSRPKGEIMFLFVRWLIKLFDVEYREWNASIDLLRHLTMKHHSEPLWNAGTMSLIVAVHRWRMHFVKFSKNWGKRNILHQENSRISYTLTNTWEFLRTQKLKLKIILPCSPDLVPKTLFLFFF